VCVYLVRSLLLLLLLILRIGIHCGGRRVIVCLGTGSRVRRLRRLLLLPLPPLCLPMGPVESLQDDLFF
jgi:hypothetical protein